MIFLKNIILFKNPTDPRSGAASGRACAPLAPTLPNGAVVEAAEPLLDVDLLVARVHLPPRLASSSARPRALRPLRPVAEET